MPAGILYWFLMFVWFIFGVWTTWPAQTNDRSAWSGFGGTLLQFVLFFLIGWRVFGAPLQ